MIDMLAARRAVQGGSAGATVRRTGTAKCHAVNGVAVAVPGLLLMAIAWAFAAAVLLAPSQARAQDQALEKLTVVTSTGRHVFQVEVMRKPEDLARGLMFRRTMAANRGMLFDFGEVKPVAMWMRNTYLPLDMVFIDQHGVVANVAENTEPLSEANIVSVRPVLSVLEVNAGTARRIGLKPGDRVEHSLFKAK
jgi:uncharacterized membrane protein (UPF0127 family)